MLEMVEGCQVPYPERLFEGYKMEMRYTYLLLNARRIPLILEKFLNGRRGEKVFWV